MGRIIFLLSILSIIVTGCPPPQLEVSEKELEPEPLYVEGDPTRGVIWNQTPWEIVVVLQRDTLAVILPGKGRFFYLPPGRHTLLVIATTPTTLWKIKIGITVNGEIRYRWEIYENLFHPPKILYGGWRVIITPQTLFKK